MLLADFLEEQLEMRVKIVPTAATYLLVISLVVTISALHSPPLRGDVGQTVVPRKKFPSDSDVAGAIGREYDAQQRSPYSPDGAGAI